MFLLQQRSGHLSSTNFVISASDYRRGAGDVVDAKLTHLVPDDSFVFRYTPMFPRNFDPEPINVYETSSPRKSTRETLQVVGKAGCSEDTNIM